MAPDEAFMAIAQGIRGIGSAYGRAAAAQDIFGKAGIELLPLLGKDLKAAAEWADRMGLSFGQGGLDSARRAAKAMRDIDASVTGLKRTLAIAAAPFIEKLVSWFNQLLEKGGGIKGVVVSAIDAIVKALVPLLDGLRMLLADLKAIAEAAKGKSWKEVLAALNPVQISMDIGGALAGVDTSKAPLSGIPDFGKMLAKGWAEGRKNILSEDMVEVPTLFGAIHVPASKIQQKGPGYDEEALKRIGDFISRGESPLQKLKEQIDELDEVFKKGGISAKRYQEGLKVANDELFKAAGLTKTPLGSFFDQISQAKDLRSMGAGGIAEKLLGKSFHDLESSLGNVTNQTGFGAEAGSVEDAQRTVRDLNQRHHDEMISVETRILLVLQQALAVQQQTDVETARVAAALESLGVVN
jgi:hypothetical protein